MENKFENNKKFVEYLLNPYNFSLIDNIHRQCGVVHERVDIYRDFTFSLNDLIQKTYLGDDVMEPKDMENHFKWCWDKICNSFLHTGFSFYENKDLCDYFQRLFWIYYYTISDKEISNLPSSIQPVYEYLFDYNHLRKMDDVEKFISIYKLFDKSFKIEQKT